MEDLHSSLNLKVLPDFKGNIVGSPSIQSKVIKLIRHQPCLYLAQPQRMLQNMLVQTDQLNLQ